MKFFSLMVLLTLALSFSVFEGFAGIFGTIRDVQGGRKDSDGKVKYDYVYTDDGFFFDYIKCRGGGYETCPTSLVIQCCPDKDQDVKDAMDYAFQQISGGNLIGTANLPSGLTVKWNSEDTDAATSLIKVWVTGEQEPEVPQ